MPSGRWIRIIAAIVGCAGGVIGLQRAAGSVSLAPSASPIRHVVVIYQENHSFDNVLGDLCVVDHRCDGSIAPMRLSSGTSVTPRVATDVIPRLDHSIASQLKAEDNGKMDGWGQIAGCRLGGNYPCITYFKPSQIPALAALARQFVISDKTFQSSDSPSWGAHVKIATGTLDGFTGDVPLPTSGVKLGPGWGCDSRLLAPWVSPSGARLMVPSCVPDPKLAMPNGGAFRASPVAYVPTIMDRLDAAHLSWRFYASAPIGSNQVNGYQWATCPIFAECLYTGQRNNLVKAENVITDAKTGRLPTFSLVLPHISAQDTSQHNGTSMLVGDNWIGQVVSAIEKGPDWASTAVFIEYDDCGCFYDHVPPPPGQGVRTPMVIISPYARARFTDRTPADAVGSMLAFVEHTFHLAPLTKLDATAYDYRLSFNYAQVPVRPGAIPPPTRISSAEERQLATFATTNLSDPT